MRLDDLETFVLVAEVGTFTEAAARLGVPKSTVSRRVARLEEALGLALLRRAARSFVLTDDGEALRARCGPALREIADSVRGLGEAADAPRGTLRLTAPIDLGVTPFLGGVLARYSERFPQVKVELVMTNRLVSLLDEDFDVAFRTHIGALPDRDDLVARRLGLLAMSAYASPEHLRRHGPASSWAELAGCRTVSHARAHRESWPLAPHTTANDYSAVAALLAAGGGVGGLPEFVAEPHVAQGTLVKLSLAWDAPDAVLSLVWLRSRHLAPRIRAFIDLTTSAASAACWLR